MRLNSTNAGVAFQLRQARPGGGRDLGQDPRPVGLFLPGRRFLRQDRRLPAQPAAQRRLGQGILSQSHTFSRPVARNYHAGRLCRFPPGRPRTSTARQACRPEGASLVKIPEQPDRAGPWQCEVQIGRHARTEELRLRRHDNSRRGAHASYSQRAVWPACSENSRANYAPNLGSGPRCVTYLYIWAGRSSFTRNLHQSPGRLPGRSRWGWPGCSDCKEC